MSSITHVSTRESVVNSCTECSGALSIVTVGSEGKSVQGGGGDQTELWQLKRRETENCSSSSSEGVLRGGRCSL
ncbi:hypothetical protein GBAR_LOCUS13948 [Geodia barretti]|uniref:Uncharacterized protein n=1 Tax=Geodia barretti TaxID=519541 RepID=A0AA35WP16_GEOBA|nr:hypothetical protein GBAR_LOCUS13948 [Geodia barretti]